MLTYKASQLLVGVLACKAEKPGPYRSRVKRSAVAHLTFPTDGWKVIPQRTHSLHSRRSRKRGKSAKMQPEGPEKFDKFDIHSTKYKSVNDQPIGVDVLVPKNAKPERLPVIVRFHGGYLVSARQVSLTWQKSDIFPEGHGHILVSVFLHVVAP